MYWSRSLAVFLALAATPAVAQTYGPPEPYYGVVSPREVMRTVAGLGLQPVSEPRLRGAVWVVRGAGREGTIVRVIVDSHSGRVVDMHAVRNHYAGPYEPDPRYVMRDQNYYQNYPEARGYPAPRPGETYEAPGYGPRGAAVPDDDDEDAPMPPGYVPHSSNTPPALPNDPRLSSRPDSTRLASKPPVVPMPKARPSDLKAGTSALKKNDAKTEHAKKEEPKRDEPKREEAKKEEDVKKDDVKEDAAKKEEPKHEQASVPLTSPKSPETTGSIPAQNKPAPEPKKQDLPPVTPLE